jgi:hypothetical protein
MAEMVTSRDRATEQMIRVFFVYFTGNLPVGILPLLYQISADFDSGKS